MSIFSILCAVLLLCVQRVSRVIGLRASNTMSSEFPTTLEGFGYAFNGQLVNKRKKICVQRDHVNDKPF